MWPRKPKQIPMPRFYFYSEDEVAAVAILGKPLKEGAREFRLTGSYRVSVTSVD